MLVINKDLLNGNHNSKGILSPEKKEKELKPLVKYIPPGLTPMQLTCSPPIVISMHYSDLHERCIALKPLLVFQLALCKLDSCPNFTAGGTRYAKMIGRVLEHIAKNFFTISKTLTYLKSQDVMT